MFIKTLNKPTIMLTARGIDLFPRWETANASVSALVSIPNNISCKYINTSSLIFRFTIRKGLRICADPGFKWVQNTMDRIDQRLVEESSV
uniref:Chemokine interleukin-8-like domain-containing protein n=1 Tax=Electrophorus electricus TaxID=8005 RepID=A0AAY5E8A2_ELEEL